MMQKDKRYKKLCWKRKLKFQDYKNCLKPSQIINIVKYFEKKGVDDDSIKEDNKEFIKNKLLLKSQQRFKIERHNVFTEKIRKITLSSNDDKRMQSIYSVETYPYEMSKDIIWKKEKPKRISIIRKYKNV